MTTDKATTFPAHGAPVATTVTLTPDEILLVAELIRGVTLASPLALCETAVGLKRRLEEAVSQ